MVYLKWKRIEMHKKLFLLILIVGAVACGMGFPEKGPEKGPEVEVRFTEVIVKVEPDVIVMPEGTYKAPLSEVEIKSEEIKELNKKFNLTSIERMFARKKPEQEVLKEFPEREERVPEEAETPDLENTFILKFPELIDAGVIIEEYEKIEDVIYAEENKSVGIF